MRNSEARSIVSGVRIDTLPSRPGGSLLGQRAPGFRVPAAASRSRCATPHPRMREITFTHSVTVAIVAPISGAPGSQLCATTVMLADDAKVVADPSRSLF